MDITNHMAYFNEKKALLDQLLHSSEALLSSSNDFDAFIIILKERERLIQKLTQFESSFKKSFTAMLTSDQDAELCRLVNLILDLDACSTAQITDEKDKISEAIKTNILEQKFFKYTGAPHTLGGELLDYKK